MLKEFNNYPTDPLGDDSKENELIMVSSFYRYIDFLRDPMRFNNEEINSSIDLMWQLIKSGEISLTIEQEKNRSSLSFYLKKLGIEETPLVIIPWDFFNRLNDNPFFKFGDFVSVASYCRDYYCGKNLFYDGEHAKKRALAFQSEAFTLLNKMASEERIELNFNPTELAYLEQLPKGGLKNLTPGINYRTPVYRKPPKNILNN